MKNGAINPNTCIVVVDAGTGDLRVMAFSLEGEILAEEHAEWFYRADRESGYYCFEPDACFSGIRDMLKKVASGLLADGKTEIAAISVTSQRDGMAFLDKDGKEIYCAPNIDLRGSEVLPDLEKNKEKILSATGLPLHAMFGLPRLLWFKKKKPKEYRRIHCVLMLCDWIAYRLTGECKSEAAAGSTSQMLNVESCKYDAELMKELGLRDDLLPETVRAAEKAGEIKADIARDLGLASGIPVYIAGSDAHCAAAGMGCFKAGDTAVIAGSTTPVLTVLDHAVIDPKGHLYSSPASIPGFWTIEGNADSTGLSYRWLRDLMYSGYTPGKSGKYKSVYEQMEADAALVPPGACGLSACAGIGVRDIEKGKNYGGFLMPVPWNIDEYQKGHFVRAMIESNAFAVAANLEAMEACTGVRPAELCVCGGQSSSKIWLATLAASAKLPVRTFRNYEATALGAALLAACGAGCFPDYGTAAEAMVKQKEVTVPENVEEYTGLYEEWKKRYLYLLDYDETRPGRGAAESEDREKSGSVRKEGRKTARRKRYTPSEETEIFNAFIQFLSGELKKTELSSFSCRYSLNPEQCRLWIPQRLWSGETEAENREMVSCLRENLLRAIKNEDEDLCYEVVSAIMDWGAVFYTRGIRKGNKARVDKYHRDGELLPLLIRSKNHLENREIELLEECSSGWSMVWYLLDMEHLLILSSLKLYALNIVLLDFQREQGIDVLPKSLDLGQLVYQGNAKYIEGVRYVYTLNAKLVMLKKISRIVSSLMASGHFADTKQIDDLLFILGA